MTSQKPVGAYTMIGGGGALIVGSFLPWLKLTAPFVGTATVAGTDGGGDGWITVVLGAITVVLGFKAMSGRKAPTRAGIVLSIITGGAVIFEFGDLNDRLNEVRGEELIHADFGVGLFLCAAGAVAVFVGSLMAANRADGLRDAQVLAEAS